MSERVQELEQVLVLGQVWVVQAPELVWEVAVECQGQSWGSILDGEQCTEVECDPRSQKGGSPVVLRLGPVCWDP